MENIVDKSGITEQRLAKLGMTKMAENLEKLKTRARKMMIAGEFYRFITPEKIEAFQQKLVRQSKDNNTYQRLSFTALEDYTKIPPEHVLVKLEEAIERKCFDRFEVAHITEVKKDPLLLGIIEGVGDKYFIEQWDDDVKITDLLKANEG